MRRIINLVRKLVNNDYIYSVFVKVVGLGIGIVLSACTARFFGAELKGINATIENDVTLYAIFLGLGIYQAYPFFRKKEPGILPVYVNNISTLFLCYEFLAILIAGFMICNHINIYLAIAIIIMPIEVYIKQLNYIVLVEHPRRRNTSSLIISCSEIFVVLGIWLFAEANVITAIAYYCIAEVLNLVLSFINLRYNPLRIRADVSRLVEFIRFGIIPMLTYLCMSVNYKIDIQMLNRFGTTSYAQIGIYALGVSLAGKIWLIPDALKDILLSKLVNGKGENEVAKVLRINLAICVFSILVLIIVGKPIILFLYSEEFSDAYYVMVLMFFGMLGMIFYKMIYSYNIAQGKRIINLIFLGIAAIINFIGNLFSIPLWGIWGAGIVSVCSYNICGICFLVYFHKVSGLSYRELIFVQKDDFSILKKFLGMRKKGGNGKHEK